MAKDKNSKRKRGVRGSRVKLAHALAEAGLKTQAALAERIADLENLEAPPKDVVNRLFRELPVEVTTLERVARALGVDAYTLYKSADEHDAAAPRDQEPVSSRNTSSWLIAGAVVSVVVVLAANWDAVFRTGNSPGLEQQATGENVAAIAQPLDLGTATVLVMTLTGDVDETMRTALRNALESHFSVATSTSAALLQELDPKSAAGRLRTEVVIDGEILTVGRLTAVRVYLYARGVRQQIWQRAGLQQFLWPGTRSSPKTYREPPSELLACLFQRTLLATIRWRPYRIIIWRANSTWIAHRAS